jgi:hypothetical protein
MLLNPISTEREVAMKILAIALLAASVIISVFSLLPKLEVKKIIVCTSPYAQLFPKVNVA